MSDTDFCDDLLGPPPPGQTPGLRRRVLDRTTKALHRRRRLRRLGWAAALAACCLGAVLLLTPRPSPAPVPPTPTPPDKDRPAPPVVEQRRPSGLDLEWVALEDPERRAEPYRAAGDRYLTEHGDLDAALRCYGEALNRGGDEALAINPDDSWLMMMIKDARIREKNDAKNGG